MARYVADQNLTALYYESGLYGTASGAATWPGLVQNFTVDEDSGYTPIRFQGTGDRDIAAFVPLGQSFKGTLSLLPQDWRWIGYTLGSIVDTSGLTSTHVLSELNTGSMNAYTSGTDNPFTSFQLYNSEKGPGTGTNFNRQYAGCMIDELTINFPSNEIINCEVNWVAQSVTYSSGTQPSITASTARPFVAGDVKMSIPSGTTLASLNSASLKISNNLATKFYSNGSRVIGTPIPGPRDISVDINVDASSEWSKTLYDQYFLGGSTFNAIIYVSAAAGTRDMAITLSGCLINPEKNPNATEGVNMTDFTITATQMVASVNDTTPRYYW